MLDKSATSTVPSNIADESTLRRGTRVKGMKRKGSEEMEVEMKKQRLAEELRCAEEEEIEAEEEVCYMDTTAAQTDKDDSDALWFHPIANFSLLESIENWDDVTNLIIDDGLRKKFSERT
ncbi:hypothetical protein WR25_23967 [Diploscapter pachys]|uniref:Uncharacterized protein n=1 Tax=Diploscapter pachys TaxID=2018661 RepID=A0A2A2LAV3_9BILA|nr:hypothetical protein WR25_23967 [Diploscapter pachys]